MHWSMFATRLAWLSIAPLGSPVVPPVYCSTATSCRGSISGSAMTPSLAMRSAKRTQPSLNATSAVLPRLNAR